jgi:hypothetical protein
MNGQWRIRITSSYYCNSIAVRISRMVLRTRLFFVSSVLPTVARRAGDIETGHCRDIVASRLVSVGSHVAGLHARMACDTTHISLISISALRPLSRVGSRVPQCVRSRSHIISSVYTYDQSKPSERMPMWSCKGIEINSWLS